MAQPLKVGVISANWGMAAHLPAWHAIEGVEVAAVCTSRRETAEAAAARHGIARAYWDHRAMAEDPDLDIIDVGTRPDLRRDMVLAALRAGKHVFAAANFAATLEAATDMRNAAHAAGVVTALDSTLAHNAAHRRIAELIADGTLGRPVSALARLSIPLFQGAQPVGDGWRWFAKAAHGASAMRNLGTHSLHLLVALLGPVEAVSCLGLTALPEWRFPSGDRVTPEVEDTAHLLLRFEGGAIASLVVGWAVPGLVGWRLELAGDKATAIAVSEGYFPAGDSVTLALGEGNAPLRPLAIPERLRRPERLHLPVDGPFPPQTRDIAPLMLAFVERIRGGAPVQPDFERAWHIEAILEAARQATATRREMRIADVTPASPG